jgi:hypothetical protein
MGDGEHIMIKTKTKGTTKRNPLFGNLLFLTKKKKKKRY